MADGTGRYQARRMFESIVDMRVHTPQCQRNVFVLVDCDVVLQQGTDEIERRDVRADRSSSTSIARIGRRWWWMSRFIVLCGLHEDRGDISPRFLMPLEPRVHCAFGIIAHLLRRAIVHIRIEYLAKFLLGCRHGCQRRSVALALRCALNFSSPLRDRYSAVEACSRSASHFPTSPRR